MERSAHERLDILRSNLTRELGDHAVISLQEFPGGRVVMVEPRQRLSLSVAWIELVPDGPGSLVLQLGDLGGRWELDVTHEDVQFLEDMVRSVVAGRASETFGPGRSTVCVTLPDGEVVGSTGGGLLAILPVPGWYRRGRTVSYAPYALEQA